MIKTECFPVGQLLANCYFVRDEEAGTALLVDTGAPSKEMEEAVDAFGGEKLQYILLTHGHFDHIGNTAALKQKYPWVKVVISEKDAAFTRRDDLNLSLFFDGTLPHFDADILVRDGDELPFGKGTIQVLSTPGHTAGGVCYRLEDCLFTGDTLMSCTTGRTDFPTGSPRQMMESIKRIAAIPEDLTLYCGHGESSTLDYERIHNFFMRDSDDDDLSE